MIIYYWRLMMTVEAKKESRILDAVYEAANNFHNAGLFNQEQMQKYDELCLESDSVDSSQKAVYLDEDVSRYLNDKCQNDDKSLQQSVNNLLRKDIEIVKQVSL